MNTPKQIASLATVFTAILFATGMFLLSAVFFSCEKKVEAPAEILEPAAVNIMNDSLYAVDSALIVKNWDELWKKVFSYENKAVLSLTKEMTPKIEQLLAYKYDSTIYMIYTDMFSAKGQRFSLCKKFHITIRVAGDRLADSAR